MPLLFSYGTLRQKSVQMATFGRILQGSADQLVGFELTLVQINDAAVLAASGKANHPIARPSQNVEARVDGITFEVSEDELAKADDYEVAAYKRISMVLASGTQAWVYVEAES